MPHLQSRSSRTGPLKSTPPGLVVLLSTGGACYQGFSVRLESGAFPNSHAVRGKHFIPALANQGSTIWPKVLIRADRQYHVGCLLRRKAFDPALAQPRTEFPVVCEAGSRSPAAEHNSGASKIHHLITQTLWMDKHERPPTIDLLSLPDKAARATYCLCHDDTPASPRNSRVSNIFSQDVNRTGRRSECQENPAQRGVAGTREVKGDQPRSA